jgi:hypothetical protein
MSKELTTLECGCVIEKKSSIGIIKPCNPDCVNYMQLSSQVKSAGGNIVTTQDIKDRLKRVPKRIKHKLSWREVDEL